MESSSIKGLKSYKLHEKVWLGSLVIRPGSYLLTKTFNQTKPGPDVIKKNMLNSAELKLILLINVKMPTTVGILTFMNRKSSILGLYELEKC